jgi:hypothetical protein
MTFRFHRAATAALIAALALPLAAHAQAAFPPPVFPPPAQHDGAHDFDFLLGDWKAHVKRLPDRLVGSTKWIEYDGISRHHPVLGSSANFEEFEVESKTAPPGAMAHIKAQTLRLYNPVSHQWSIYGLDVDAGGLGLPATVGAFTNGAGEFFDHENWKGRMVLVRFQWSHADKDHALMRQAFSADGGKTWEVNWICELTREGA